MPWYDSKLNSHVAQSLHPGVFKAVTVTYKAKILRLGGGGNTAVGPDTRVRLNNLCIDVNKINERTLIGQSAMVY